jgi:hypothetical protein
MNIKRKMVLFKEYIIEGVRVMAQVRNEDINIFGPPDKECRICKEKKVESIFYVYEPDNNIFYVCEECFEVIESLFIDVLLENEDKYKIAVKEELDRIDKKIKNLKASRKRRK